LPAIIGRDNDAQRAVVSKNFVFIERN